MNIRRILRQTYTHQWNWTRHASTQPSEHIETGHINPGPNEGILFFDSKFLQITTTRTITVKELFLIFVV